MGFYIELKKTDDSGMEFRDQNPPPVFWTLYGLAGFALTCMGLAAHSLLFKLLTTGDLWDLVLVGCILSSVPIYILIGLKLLLIRKYIRFSDDLVMLGYKVGNYEFNLKNLHRSEISELLLANRKPSANVAPAHHQDPQYYIRGHWLLMLKTSHDKFVTLDRHTEKEALYPLENRIKDWLVRDGNH